MSAHVVVRRSRSAGPLIRSSDLNGYHVKALIVCNDRIRRWPSSRSERPDSERVCDRRVHAVSDDGAETKKTLEDFRSQRVGVLCTRRHGRRRLRLSEIVVVGYATSKLTALYVRQVVARRASPTAARARSDPPAYGYADAGPILERLLLSGPLPLRRAGHADSAAAVTVTVTGVDTLVNSVKSTPNVTILFR